VSTPEAGGAYVEASGGREGSAVCVDAARRELGAGGGEFGSGGVGDEASGGESAALVGDHAEKVGGREAVHLAATRAGSESGGEEDRREPEGEVDAVVARRHGVLA
jgi:hypothetical protein